MKRTITPDDYKISRIMTQAAIESKVTTEKIVWITAEGNKIPVKEMTTKHIRAAINCWNDKGKSDIPSDYLGGKDKWMKIFENELISRN